MRNLAFFKRILSLSLLMINLTYAQGVVTYLDKEVWGGRLGDMLVMYIKAKWVAFEYKLPLLYKPFHYSDQLEMHVREQHYSEDISKTYKKQLITCYDASEISTTKNVSKDYTFYQIHYYFNPIEWGEYQRRYDSQEIMAWPGVYTNAAFRAELKRNIAPRDSISLPDLPKDKITVAVHIRNGIGFDLPLLSRQLYSEKDFDSSEKKPAGKFADQYWPLKFPPLQYYVDQIKRLSGMYGDRPMYLYIYTDNNNPIDIMRIIERAVNKPNITFECRETENHHTKNVLEDIFAMARYDCLIRSGSNYPQISQLIGNHKVIIWPKSRIWVGNTLVIDDVGVYVAD